MKTILIALLALGVCVVGCSKTKECQYCKETDIQYRAEICKHCGKDPDGLNGSEIRLERYKEEAEQKKRGSFWSGEYPKILILFVIPSAIAIWWYIKDLRARRQKEDGDID